MSGLSDVGIDKKTSDDCLQEMKTDVWDTISSKANLSSAAPMGQLLGILSERESLLWDAIEAVHDARIRDASSGSALRSLGLLTGTKPQTATPTIVACQVTLAPGFDQLAGAMVAHVANDPTQTYENQNEVSNLGTSTVTITVNFVAQNPGAIACPANTLNVIAQPLTGWTAINNSLDGTEGLDDDTDATLRLRQETELDGEGSSTTDSIRSGVLRNLSSNITNCVVIANEGDSVDANGILPHSFETIARGLATDSASSQNLAEQILAFKDAGDRAFGQSSTIVTDSQGKSHTIGYTWVTDADIYVSVDVTIDDNYPVDGDTQVINAILAVGAAWNPGDTAVAMKLRAAPLSVTGVDDVPALRLDFTSSPTNTANLSIPLRQIGKLDSSRIVVNHV